MPRPSCDRSLSLHSQSVPPSSLLQAEKAARRDHNQSEKATEATERDAERRGFSLCEPLCALWLGSRDDVADDRVELPAGLLHLPRQLRGVLLNRKVVVHRATA